MICNMSKVATNTKVHIVNVPDEELNIEEKKKLIQLKKWLEEAGIEHD